jgi:probable HAF family extracellular repeat protein
MFLRFVLQSSCVLVVLLAATAAWAVDYAFVDLGVTGDTTSYAYGINSSNVVAGRAYTPSGNPAWVWSPNFARTNLPTLGGTTGVGFAINDSGVVVGLAYNSSNSSRAFKWTPAVPNGNMGTIVNTGDAMMPGTTTSRLMAINSAGQTLGYGSVSGSARGFYWDGVSGTMTQIPAVSGGSDVGWLNSGINSSQLCVGYVSGDYSVIWHPGDANATNISTDINAAIPGALGGRAMAVNNSGEIVGYYTTTFNFEGSPYLYKDSTHIVGLPGLGANPEQTGGGGQSRAINDGGAVVGWAYLSNGTTQHAFLWTPTVPNGTTGTTVDLNSLSLLNPSVEPAGFFMYDAYGINSQGSIVGHLWNGLTGGAAVFRAFALAPTLAGDANLDQKVDINDLTRVLTNYNQTAGMAWTTGDFNGDSKVDINDLTIVLAHYNQSLGSSAGVVAVPEPGAMALLAGGLLGLMAFLWRRRLV